LIVHVDPASPVPVFEQLRGQIERMVVVGTLPPGSVLPTIRDLARDLGLARGTVARVYDELARDGIVQTRGRHGTRVLGPGGRRSTGGELKTAADAFAVVVRQLGLPDNDGHAALDAALARLGPAPTRACAQAPRSRSANAPETASRGGLVRPAVS
jgi:DNA-binding transcriptional regulator YhcF (GntR family)